MALYAEVFLCESETKGYSGRRIPRTRFIVRLGTVDAKQDGKLPWSIVGPVPVGFMALSPATSGLYDKNEAGYFRLYADGDQVIELRATRGDNAGIAKGAKGGRQGGLFLLTGQWRGCPPTSPHGGTSGMFPFWGGVMIKGAVSLGAREEVGIGAVQNLAFPTGASFISNAQGVGASAGASAGIAIVIATGFTSPSQFDGFESSDWDWDLAFGPKWSGIVKGVRGLPKILSFVNAAQDALDNFAKARRLAKLLAAGGTEAREIYGVAKGCAQCYWLDDQQRNITAIDIPGVGAGAQVGVHWAWAKTHVTSTW